MDPENMTDVQKKVMVGKCAYSMLGVMSSVAFFCGLYANAHCDFVGREVNLKPGVNLTAVCDGLDVSNEYESVCVTLFTDAGIGFYGWYGTVPVDQQVCFSYTWWNPEYGYITPEFDIKFNSASAFAITANVLGSFAWFTLMLSTCCHLNQERLMGLGFYFFLACLFQGLTLLIFKSDICERSFFAQYFPGQDEDSLDDLIESVQCVQGRGSKLAITATVFYFICNNLVPIAIVPTPIGYRDYQEAMAEDVVEGAVPAPSADESA